MRRVIQQLWDYLDGELPADRADGISRTLEACAGAGRFGV